MKRPELKKGDIVRISNKYYKGMRPSYRDKRTFVVEDFHGDINEGDTIVTLKYQGPVHKYTPKGVVEQGYKIKKIHRQRRHLWFTGYNIIDGNVDMSSRGYKCIPKKIVKSYNDNQCHCESLFLNGHEEGCPFYKGSKR